MLKFPHYGQKIDIGEELLVITRERLATNILKEKTLFYKKS